MFNYYSRLAHEAVLIRCILPIELYSSVAVPRMCVCACVRVFVCDCLCSFLPPRASRPRNIGRFWYSRLKGDRNVILSKVLSSERPAPGWRNGKASQAERLPPWPHNRPCVDFRRSMIDVSTFED